MKEANKDKERLEEIKKELELDWSDISYVVNQDDVKWLIERAERVQELEEEVFELKARLVIVHQYNDILKMIADDYEKQNKRYREALEEIKSLYPLRNAGYQVSEIRKIVIKALEE